MNEGIFWSSYTESVKFLKNVKLLKENNTHKRMPYSKVIADYSRVLDYKELYQNLVDHRDYDILLIDDSMFQMNIRGEEIRMMFIQNPLLHISFESFLENMGWDVKPEQIDQYHELFYDDYNQTLEGMKLNGGAVYMRYDVDAIGREGNENIHAYTHLHIGINNKIRIPVGVFITPIAFTMFVVRHVYYDNWVDSAKTDYVKKYVKHCDPLPEELWTERERQQLFIS